MKKKIKKILKFLKKWFIKICSVTPVTKKMALSLSAWWSKKRYESRFYKKFQVDDKIIMFESFMGRQMSCSPKALYLAMLDDPKYKDYVKVWAFKKPEDYEYLTKNPNTVVVKFKSWQYYRYHASAKYWITNSRIPNEIQIKPEQVYVQCWHGTPLKRLGYDIKHYTGSKSSTEDLRKNYTIDAMRYTYMLSPSDFYTEKITSAFNLKALNKENIFIQKGYPRNDFLYAYKEEEADEIKKKLNVPAGKKIILYAPTWRENQHEAGVGYTYSLGVDFDRLQRELSDDYVILFRAHYFISNAFDFAKYNGFIINASDYDDINHLYVISDILITDYSSVFFDYANLNRPIIFYMYDFEEYKNQMRDFYFGIEELPGPIVKEEDGLIESIKKAGEEEFVLDETYMKFNDKFNPYREPCSAKVLEDIIS